MTTKSLHRMFAAFALTAGLMACCLAAGEEPPVRAEDPAPAEAAQPFEIHAPVRTPAGGEQEGPYYAVTGGRAGLQFLVSRTLEGEPLRLQCGEFRLEYARDWHRGDGGLGHWLGARGAWRYREIAILGSFDDRWFGPDNVTRIQSAHLLFGGVGSQGHARPYSEGGFGLCAWWPRHGSTRVLPEVGFRAVVWRAPAYQASLSAFRQGLVQDNGSVSWQCELYGSGAWNFRHKEGWLYDGGARVTMTVEMLQLSLGYHLYGVRASFAQGPAASLTIHF